MMTERTFSVLVLSGKSLLVDGSEILQLVPRLEQLLQLSLTVVLIESPEAERLVAHIRGSQRGRFYWTHHERVFGWSGSGQPRSLGQCKSVATFIRTLDWRAGIDPSDILLIGNGRDGLERIKGELPGCGYLETTEPGELRQIIQSLAERLEEIELNSPPSFPNRDPAWTIVEEGANPAREMEIEALLAVSNGYSGTRGTLFERGSPLGPGTLIAGIFDIVPGDNPVPGLVAAPDWVRVRIELLPPGSSETELTDAGHDLSSGAVLENRRTLDMNGAMMWRELRHRDSHDRETWIEGFRYASQVDRHLLVQCINLRPENYTAPVRIETEAELYQTANRSYLNPYPSRFSVLHGLNLPPGAPTVVNYTYASGAQIAFASSSVLRLSDGRVLYPNVNRIGNRVAEYWEFEAELGKQYRIERLITVFTSRDAHVPAVLARDTVRRARNMKIEAHLGLHHREWQRRWSIANVEIAGDFDSERALRFACYNLLSAANPEDEKVSIGARALTGNSYLGHVFWDTEIFMLPFYIHVAPDIARSLLMYRYHLLSGARANAANNNFRGAMYPWESADSGLETTPTSILLPSGERIRVVTGQQEHHITADVAYTVWRYCEITGDQAFLDGPGAEILIETARFWASRVTADSEGVCHIEHAIGPDEYHEDIADNFYTNEMARWNLETAAWVISDLSRRHPEAWREMRARLGFVADESDSWLLIAQRLYRARVRNGVFEQFRGYFDLEDHLAREENQPGGSDFRIFLDVEKLGKCQLIKQADVLMLLHLFPDRFSPEEQRANFEYYEPRTVHGSSLSPAIYALMASRTGFSSKAVRYFKMAAEVDLQNNMGNASGGVHSAAQGGLWQSTVFGFAGFRANAEFITLDPATPESWQALRFQVLWRGQMIAVSIEPRSIEINHRGWTPLPVRVGGSETTLIDAGKSRRWERAASRWLEVA